MKLSLAQSGVTVTIECERDGQTGDDMAQFCRELLMAQGYQPYTVSESLPTEEDVVQIIEDAIKSQKEFDTPDERVHIQL
jgi:hypothetical protein